MNDERPISDIVLHLDERMAILKELLAQYQNDGNAIEENDDKLQCSSVKDIQSPAYLD